MNWNNPRFAAEDIEASEEVSRYFVNFPRGRDVGLLDYEGDTVRAVAWLVFLPSDAPGYGFVDADTPELSITTFETFRGIGIGTELLKTLLASAKARGCPAVSLSVEDGNKARHLYERVGFAVIGRNGGSDTMLLKLH